jgi:hypothetical protein
MEVTPREKALHRQKRDLVGRKERLADESLRENQQRERREVLSASRARGRRGGYYDGATSSEAEEGPQHLQQGTDDEFDPNHIKPMWPGEAAAGAVGKMATRRGNGSDNHRAASAGAAGQRQRYGDSMHEGHYGIRSGALPGEAQQQEPYVSVTRSALTRMVSEFEEAKTESQREKFKTRFEKDTQCFFGDTGREFTTIFRWKWTVPEVPLKRP